MKKESRVREIEGREMEGCHEGRSERVEKVRVRDEEANRERERSVMK